MAFTKRNYVSGETVITADNLNAIQDELIRIGGLLGKDIQSATINDSGHLILTLTDGTTLDAGVAKGAQGTPGAKGDTGAQGPKGDPGAKGDTGAQGPKGDDGAKGDTGAAGADGITPHIGDNGNWYIGSTDTGKPSRGATGVQGPGAEVFYIGLAGNYPNYTCPVAMTDIKAAYEAGKVLECRCAVGEYIVTLPLFIPMPILNTWIFSGSGALPAMNFPSQSLTIAIVNGTVQASDTQLVSKDDIPAALPNPNALTVKIGSTIVTYDGSSAETVEIADGTEVSY